MHFWFSEIRSWSVSGVCIHSWNLQIMTDSSNFSGQINSMSRIIDKPVLLWYSLLLHLFKIFESFYPEIIRQLRETFQIDVTPYWNEGIIAWSSANNQKFRYFVSFLSGKKPGLILTFLFLTVPIIFFMPTLLYINNCPFQGWRMRNDFITAKQKKV